MKHKKPIISLTTIIIFWSIISFFEIIKPIFLPTPLEILFAFKNLITITGFYKHIVYTLLRTFTAFIIASILGISGGLLLGYFIEIKGYFEFIIDFFRTMPSPALIPLALVFFGIGELSKIIVVIFSVSLIILVNTIYGVKNVKKIRKQVFNVLQANKTQKFKKLIIPESMPHIISGLRISLSIALIIVVVTEMLVGTHFGLGYIIQTEQLLYNIPEMYTYIIILGIIGFLLNAIVIKLEKRIIFWTGE